MQGGGPSMLMPVMQIRPVGMFMLHRLMPVGMRVIPVLIHRRCVRAVDVGVMVEVVMRMPVRVAQRLMGVAMRVSL